MILHRGNNLVLLSGVHQVSFNIQFLHCLMHMFKFLMDLVPILSPCAFTFDLDSRPRASTSTGILVLISQVASRMIHRIF